MRMYHSLVEAISEIQRDIYSGEPVEGTRVQQQLGKFNFRERIGYSYGISGASEAWPSSPENLVRIARQLDFKFFEAAPADLVRWLYAERELRMRGNLGEPAVLTETLHPALASTIEGNWPAYTYADRLNGALPALTNALVSAPDSRRAFWPIFRPEDALRASAPTRVPCSLGYGAMIRPTDLGPTLYFSYISRSVDFDTFWLSDIWLAREFQVNLLNWLKRTSSEFRGVELGPVMHYIISFHSFEVEGTEVY